jgi:hypothetical protein
LPRKSKRELFRSPHRLPLESLVDVRREMSRLYRGGLNGRVKPGELTRFVFTLDKIRSCLEAEGAAAATAEATAKASAMPTEICIVTVPTTFTIDENDPTRIKPMLFIEHEAPTETIEAEAIAEPEPVIEESIKPEPVDDGGVFRSASLRRRYG